MEIVKDFFGAIGGRLRSHFIGSILLSMLAFNWDSVLFLFMDGNSVWIKIAYIKKHWDIVLPAIVGLAIGFVNPWVVYVGAFWAKFPSEMLHSLQDDAKHKRAMKLLTNQATANEKKADLAKKEDAALKSIDDEDIRDRLKVDTAPAVDTSSKPIRTNLHDFFGSSPDQVHQKFLSEVTSFDRNIINRMGKRKGGLLIIVNDEDFPIPVQIDGQAAPKGSIGEYNESMQKLIQYGVVESKISHSNKVSVYELTEYGRSLIEY